MTFHLRSVAVATLVAWWSVLPASAEIGKFMRLASSPPSSISSSILLLLRHSASRLRTRSCHALRR